MLNKRKLTTVTALFSIALSQNCFLEINANESPFPLSVHQQITQIRGNVVDPNGEPIIGATVVEKGTTNGTVTDLDGNFILNVSPGKVIQISYIGFATQEVKAADNLKIELKEDTEVLDEVVVVGYGKSSVRKILNSVTKVNTDKIENTSATNLGSALSGIAPGLVLKQSGGGPGNDVPSISIRGGGEPLYVIDGVVRDKSEFASLSPNDIGNISILKDAGASAVYGSRAANGVVLVETKKAESNSISYSNLFGFSTFTLDYDRMSSAEYADFNNSIARMYGVQEPWTAEEVQKFKDGSDPQYRSTDWFEETFRMAPMQRHNFSISGVEKSIDYLLSVSYQNQGSAYKETDAYSIKTYSVLAKVGKKFEKAGLKFDLTLRGTYKDLDNVPFDAWTIFGWCQQALPYKYPYDDEGNYISINGIYNPLYQTSTENGYDRTRTRLFSGVFNATWDIPKVKGLQIGVMANYGTDFIHWKRWQAYQPTYTEAGDKIENQAPRLSESRSSRDNSLLQGFIRYNNKFGQHSVNASLYYEQATSYYADLSASRLDYVSTIIDYMFAGPQKGLTNGGSGDESARIGYIGRLDYDYADKYLISGTFRYDGSERFQKGNRWGFFPSLALGWRISEEKFFKNNIPASFISNMKLRASYGETGNDDIARFAFLSTFNSVDKRYYWNDQWVTGYSDNGLPAGNITWYKQKSYNVGLETDFLNGRLKTSVDGFYYRTTGYLADPKTVYSTPLGTTLPKINYGATRRGGYEINATWSDKIGADFSYNIGANLTHYVNFWELNPDETEANLKNPWVRTTYEYGYSAIGFKTEGFYTSTEDVLNHPHHAAYNDLLPGDNKLVDLNGDGVIDDNDKTRIGKNSTPNYYFGVNLGASYKGFYLSAVIQGATNFDVWLSGLYNYSTGGSDVLTLKNQTDVWTPDNTDALFPRINYTGVRSQNSGYTSEAYYLNVSYVRLKSLEFGYNFKKQWMKYVGAESARVFVGGSNLLTVAPGTHGLVDPETGSGANYAYPVEKTFTFGMNITF